MVVSSSSAQLWNLITNFVAWFPMVQVEDATITPSEGQRFWFKGA